MPSRYLQVTYRKGKPLAAYLQLPRETGVKVVRSERAGNGVIVDFGPEETPIGIEITSPATVTAAQLDAVLLGLGLGPLEEGELAPLAA